MTVDGRYLTETVAESCPGRVTANAGVYAVGHLP
jgi:hypothetical protein